jgi:hypothetical protein
MGASACLLISLIVGSWRRSIADELNKSKRGIVDDLGTLKPTQPGAVGDAGCNHARRGRVRRAHPGRLRREGRDRASAELPTKGHSGAPCGFSLTCANAYTAVNSEGTAAGTK